MDHGLQDVSYLFSEENAADIPLFVIDQDLQQRLLVIRLA